MSKTDYDLYTQRQQIFDQRASRYLNNPAPVVNEHPEQLEQEEPLKENDSKGLTKKKFCEVQDLMERHLRKLEFDIDVYYHDEMPRKAPENSESIISDISSMIDSLNGFGFTPEYFETLERIGNENEFENKASSLRKQIQNRIFESLEKYSDHYEKTLQPLNFKFLFSELIKQASEIAKSQGEAVWLIIKKVEILKFKVDNDGEILTISSMKNGKSGNRDIPYEEIRNARRIVIKMEGMEYTEKMMFGLDFLFENCFENVCALCFDFNGKFIYKKEAPNFRTSSVWQKKSIRRLTVDFTGCTFEDENIPLIFFKNQLENLEDFTYYLGNTNLTQRAVNTLNNLIVPALKSLKLNLSNLEITDLRIFSIKVSQLKRLDLDLRKTALGDNEMIHFSEETLPKMENLSELRLWLHETNITDNGLLSLLASIKQNIASQLKVFLLGVSENNVTDESLEDLASNLLPLMKNLEEFKLSVEKTLITDKSMFTLCKNIKYFAPALRTFALDIGRTAVTDKMMNALASVSLHLMKKLEVFQMWFNETTISDQSLYNFYSSAASSGVFSALEEFEIDCSGNDITDQSLAIFANKVLPGMKKLKTFTFFANRVKLGDLSLKPLFQNLGKTQLEKIMISLEETDIGKQSIMSLAETLSSLKNLTEISLWLNKTKLEDSSITRICSSLKSLAKNLECLRIGLDDTVVTDKGIRVLGDEIAPKMESLKELQIGLSRTQIGDLSFKPLFENLKRTPAMRTMQFWLSGSLIGDQGLLALANLKANNLETVTLEVEDTAVTDLSIIPLMSILKNEDMKKLNFSFKRTKVTTEAIKVLSEKALENLRNLHNFKLCLEQDQAYASNFYAIMQKKAHTIRQFEMQLNKTYSDSAILLLAGRILPNLTQVQDFRVYWTIEPSDQVYKAFCLNALKAIKNMKTFYISRSACVITSAPGKSLEELRFEFNGSKITDAIMQKILLDFKGKFSMVKVFSLMLRMTKVLIPSMKQLASDLSIATNLESLHIDLKETVISDLYLRDAGIWQSFEKFARSLKSLNLNFEIVNSASLQALAEYGLAHMSEKLETLCLDLGDNVGNGVALEKVFEKMKNCVANLETFSLSIHGKEPLLPRVLEVLATEVFSNMRKVKNFQFKLEKTKITDTSLMGLFFALKNEVLKNMKSFVLIFEDEHGITSESFDYLSTEILGQLKNVETFGFRLCNNEKIQNESLVKFNKKLQDIGGHITKLNLRFERTGLSGDTINEFAQNTLGKLRNLKDLDLDFGMNTLGDEAIVNLFGGIGMIIGRLKSVQLHLPRTGITDVVIEALKEQFEGKMSHWEWFHLMRLVKRSNC